MHLSWLLRLVGTHFAHQIQNPKRSPPKGQQGYSLASKGHPLTFFSPISPRVGTMDRVGPRSGPRPSVGPSAPYETFNLEKGPYETFNLEKVR